MDCHCLNVAKVSFFSSFDYHFALLLMPFSWTLWLRLRLIEVLVTPSHE
uniref:Uncharacterized protein n=1 Tax=Rhizophora mucronata TaxID=61149 RepID=A0A2P2JYJ2_RHIMU